MTRLGLVLAALGLGMMTYAFWRLAEEVRKLTIRSNEHTVRIAQLDEDIAAALRLARARLVAGRSGR